MAIEPSTTIVLTLGQATGLATGLGAALVTVLSVLLKTLLAQFRGDIDERFKEIAKQGDAWRDLERSFLSLRAELPEKYVRREDYIRGQTVIEAKLDAISSELKLVQIKGAKRE